MPGKRSVARLKTAAAFVDRRCSKHADSEAEPESQLASKSSDRIGDTPSSRCNFFEPPERILWPNDWRVLSNPRATGPRGKAPAYRSPRRGATLLAAHRGADALLRSGRGVNGPRLCDELRSPRPMCTDCKSGT